jgi:hypothetical protein
LKRRDALWLLAYPIYQFIGTVRHEGCHALAAVLEGARITKVVLLPSRNPEGGILWGYVNWRGGNVDWFPTAAPYLNDLLIFVFFLWFYARKPRLPRWVWLNGFVLGFVSPILDLGFNYRKVLTGRHGDVYALMSYFPHPAVHVAFAGSLALVCLGTWFVLKEFNREDALRPQSR